MTCLASPCAGADGRDGLHRLARLAVLEDHSATTGYHGGRPAGGPAQDVPSAIQVTAASRPVARS